MTSQIDTLRAILTERGFIQQAARIAAATGTTVDDMLLNDGRRRGACAALRELFAAVGAASIDDLMPWRPPAIPLMLAPCTVVADAFARLHCTCAGCKAARPYRLAHRWDVNRTRAKRRYHQLKARGICPRCMGPNPRRAAECHDCSNERKAA